MLDASPGRIDPLWKGAVLVCVGLADHCNDAAAVKQARDNPMDYYTAWFKAELVALESL